MLTTYLHLYDSRARKFPNTKSILVIHNIRTFKTLQTVYNRKDRDWATTVHKMNLLIHSIKSHHNSS